MPDTYPSATFTPRSQRLQRYCALGVGVLACAGIATNADASITFINLGNEVLIDPDPVSNIPTTRVFDLNNDGQLDIQFAQLIVGANGGAFVQSPAGASLGVIGLAVSSFYYPGRLAAGALIGPGQPFIGLTGVVGSLAAGTGYPNSQWTGNTSPGFLGIQFQAGGTTLYGWVQIAVAANTGTAPRALTLINAAFETSGGPITAGAVPEPATTVGLLALGAAGLAAHRRRRSRGR